MKRPGALMAAAAVATAAAFSNFSDHEIRIKATSQAKSAGQELAVAQDASGNSAEELFAPRFDGLRFIETLVTAHR